MTLTVQDDSGTQTEADSYVSLAAFQSYCAGRGMNVEDDEDEDLEAALRLAFDYVDSKWRYKGSKSTTTQNSEFPRTDLVDWSSQTVSGIPKRLKDAQCDLAFAG